MFFVDARPHALDNEWMSERKMQLYSEYFETGHMGAKEVDTTYSLSAAGLARETVLTLEILVKRSAFPGNELLSSETECLQIDAMDVVEFIKSKGRLVV